jgi:hypothetical protein
MARYATSLGKGPKKKKRSSSNRASIRMVSSEFSNSAAKNNQRGSVKTNDGDPHIYYERERKSKNKQGGYDTTTVKRKIKDKSAANPVKGKPKGTKVYSNKTGHNVSGSKSKNYDQIKKNIAKDRKKYE